jgi:anti-anti-sigma regulatory factor
MPGVEPFSARRVGTQVVVRLAGDIDDALAPRLTAGLGEIADLAITRVVVDLSAADSVSGAGLAFLRQVGDRWQVRLLDPPDGLAL